MQPMADNLSPWRVLVPEQVGVASLKEKSKALTLHKFYYLRTKSMRSIVWNQHEVSYVIRRRRYGIKTEDGEIQAIA